VTRSQAPYRLKHESKMKTIEEQRVEARLLAYNILGVEGHARAWDGTRKNDKHLNTHINCTNETTSWLVHSWNFLVLGQAMSNLRFTRLTTARTWGKPPSSPLLYTLCLSTRPTSRWHFVMGLPRLWGPITLCADLWLKWSLKQSYNPLQDLSNGMLHTTCMQGNWVHSRLLAV
jgi:hypothetical protein